MMLLEPRTSVAFPELEKLAESVRHDVYKTMVNKQLPALVSKKIIWLRGLKDIPINIETVMNPVDDFESILQSEEYAPSRRDSGILESLFELVHEARNDSKFVFNPKSVTNYKLKELIKKNVMEYFDTRQQRYMNSITQHIQALIRLDDKPEEAFGDFRSLQKGFDTEKMVGEYVTIAECDIDKGKIKRQTFLDDAILIALSNIPSYIKENEVHDIQPDLSPAVTTI